MTDNHKNPNGDNVHSFQDLEALRDRFDALFPSEIDCVEEIMKHIKPDRSGHNEECESDNLLRDRGSRFAQCQDCNGIIWMTANTFFHKMKLARPWLFSIWTKSLGVAISAFQLSMVLKIAYSTCWSMEKKLALVIADDMKGRHADEIFSLESAFFINSFGRRSLETPAFEHPISEQAEAERRAAEEQEETSSQSSKATTQGPQMNETEAQIYDTLTQAPVHFNDILNATAIQPGLLAASLSLMEVNGLIERTDGDYFYKVATQNYLTTLISQHSQNKWADYSPNTPDEVIEQLLHEFFVFLKRTSKRIARKYLQLFIAAFCCLFEKPRWSGNQLLQKCCRFRPVHDLEIYYFSTPLLVMAPQIKAA